MDATCGTEALPKRSTHALLSTLLVMLSSRRYQVIVQESIVYSAHKYP